MRGMLIKDIRFLLNQKASLIIFLGLGLYFMIGGNDVTLALAYCTMMVAIFTTSSISYDSYNHGMAFLLILPVQRKTYAVSKYIFCLTVVVAMGILLSVTAWLVSLFGGAMTVAEEAVSLSGLVVGVLTSVSMAMIMAAIMIPIYLKFGAEKSRYALAIVMGVVLAAGFVMEKVSGNVAVEVMDQVNRLQELSEMQVMAVILLLAAVVVAVSMLISIKIMEKKEY